VLFISVIVFGFKLCHSTPKVHFVFYVSFFIRQWNDEKLAKSARRLRLQHLARRAMA
jgi:hypothetical protein